MVLPSATGSLEGERASRPCDGEESKQPDPAHIARMSQGDRPNQMWLWEATDSTAGNTAKIIYKEGFAQTSLKFRGPSLYNPWNSGGLPEKPWITYIVKEKNSSSGPYVDQNGVKE